MQEHENKIENKFKDEICSICYTNKVSKLFVPCKHSFCDFCADKLKKIQKNVLFVGLNIYSLFELYLFIYNI